MRPAALWQVTYERQESLRHIEFFYFWIRQNRRACDACLDDLLSDACLEPWTSSDALALRGEHIADCLFQGWSKTALFCLSVSERQDLHYVTWCYIILYYTHISYSLRVYSIVIIVVYSISYYIMLFYGILYYIILYHIIKGGCMVVFVPVSCGSSGEAVR